MSKERATFSVKMEARRLRETEGLSYAKIGERVGFDKSTVTTWAKADGWVKAGDRPDDGQPVEDINTPDTSHVIVDTDIVDAVGVDTTDAPRSDQDLRDRLAALEADNARLTDEVEELTPTYKLGEMFTDRVKWLTEHSPEGEKYWINRAEAMHTKTNRQRVKEGFPPYDVKDDPGILEGYINELKTKEAMGIDNSAVEPASRKVKLFKMRLGMPTIEQIPMENQINNMAGSLADGILRYTRKGFKLTDPFLCPRAGCFHAAGVDEFKRWTHDGYCTEKHRNEVEGAQSSPTAGLSVRDVMTSV